MSKEVVSYRCVEGGCGLSLFEVFDDAGQPRVRFSLSNQRSMTGSPTGSGWRDGACSSEKTGFELKILDVRDDVLQDENESDRDHGRPTEHRDI